MSNAKNLHKYSAFVQKREEENVCAPLSDMCWHGWIWVRTAHSKNGHAVRFRDRQWAYCNVYTENILYRVIEKCRRRVMWNAAAPMDSHGLLLCDGAMFCVVFSSSRDRRNYWHRIKNTDYSDARLTTTENFVFQRLTLILFFKKKWIWQSLLANTE